MFRLKAQPFLPDRVFLQALVLFVSAPAIICLHASYGVSGLG